MNRIKNHYNKLVWFIALLLPVLLAGCGGGTEAGGGTWNSGGTVSAPRITSTTPAKRATGVAINSLVMADFNVVMTPATINETTFKMANKTLGGTPVSGEVSYLGTTATFRPYINLAVSTEYTVTMTTGAKDLAGIALASNYVWNFTTGTVSDITAPRVSATGAYGTTGVKSGKTGLPINRDTTATFNEAMNPATICGPANLTTACPVATFTLVKSSNGAPVAGVVSYTGKTANFNPDNDLETGTLYISTITTGAKDLAGNQLAAPYIWSWSTGLLPDTTRPVIDLTSPVNAAINVPANKVITARFDKDMLQTTVLANFTVKETLTSNPVPGMVVYDALTNIAAFTPNNPLSLDRDYTATVSAAATDLAGNPLSVFPAVLPKPNPWTFKTSAATPPPVIIVNLGKIASYGIASAAGVTNATTVPITHINGNVVLNPTATCNAVTVGNKGTFGLCGGAPPTINGTVITQTNPDTVTADAVMADLLAAFRSISRTADAPAGTLNSALEIAAPTGLGNVAGSVLVEGQNMFTPGVYHGGSIVITGDLTLDAQGDPTAVFVFQSDSSVKATAGSPGTHTRILLKGGAKAANVWWKVGSSATLGLYAEWQGNILSYASITMENGAKSCGRLLAGAYAPSGAFVFESNIVTVPGNPHDLTCL